MANLLVVDDDQNVADMVGTFFSILGHAVRYASNGSTGLAAVRLKHPDLIVLDVDMPTLSGPEMAYQLLVEDAGKEEIPILLVSAVPSLGMIAEEIGTPYFIAKPFSLDELEGKLNQALKEKRPPWRHSARLKAG